MQTTELCLTATIDRPESLIHEHNPTIPGVHFGRITYLITGVPVDVPVFEVVHVCRRLLSCRADSFNIYEFTWPELYVANRR